MSTSPRILLFATTGSPFGGVETWMDNFCPFLTDRGWDLRVVLVKGASTNCPRRFKDFHPNLKVDIVDGTGLNRESRVRSLCRKIAQYKPELVMPLGVLDAVAAASRMRSRLSLRLVGRAQGNLPPMLADLEDNRDCFDAVVCPGRLTADYLVTCAGFEDSRVYFIPNGAKLPIHKRIERTSWQPLRLCYVGRFTRKDKRVLDLPVLCRCLREAGVPFRFQLVGDGPSKDELLSGLSEFSSDVVYRGAMKPDQIYSSVYPDADVLILPSSSETFGVVIAEAMMHGIIPVTSQYIGWASQGMVVHGETGLTFPVGDMQSAARQIRILLDDPVLSSALAARAREFAHQHLTWDRCVRDWHATLEDIRIRPLLKYRQMQSGNLELHGRLDRLPLPTAWVDCLRRARCRVFGSPVPPGGEEWPLFNRYHTPERLVEIERKMREIDARSLKCVSEDDEAQYGR